MSLISRLRVSIGGAPVVGPSVMTFYSTGASLTGFPNAVKAFLATNTLDWPAGLTFTVPSGGDVLTAETGELYNVWDAAGEGGIVTGTNTGAYSKGVGAQIRWRTGGIVGGRRVVGSTFLVPIAGGDFDADGTLVSAFVTRYNAAAATLLTAVPSLAIYSRPKPPASGIGPDRPGQGNVIVSGAVQDRTSWLRSRRT